MQYSNTVVETSAIFDERLLKFRLDLKNLRILEANQENP